MNKQVTIVTGLWNLGRGEIGEGFKRPYIDYLSKFEQLLRTDAYMYIYASPEDEHFIWEHRSPENTTVNKKSIEELKEWFPMYDKVQEIRRDPKWSGQAGWLSESPQAILEMYNPVVMSKMFLLNDASIYNPFNSKYFFWIDAGIANTVHPGYFYHDKVFDNLPTYCKSVGREFIYLSYPYVGGGEVHGFAREPLHRYCHVDYVGYVCRGGFFGGTAEAIRNLNGLYYNYLSSTLGEKLMGTEESLFTIIAHAHPELIHRFELEDNGLVWPFFEKLKEYTTTSTAAPVALYVLTYNSPKQFALLCQSFERYDSSLLSETKKYLLNNSTNPDTADQYKDLCKLYGFEEIKKDNIGICGGRQFIAEHFAETEHKYCIFYEDDMFFYDGSDPYCKNGFRRFVPNLLGTVVSIVEKENFDFLKFNFTEFFGDNSTQWSWYNVPQAVRVEIWPDNPKLPEVGLSPNAPRTEFTSIKALNGVSYATGEIYYSNWPQIVTQEGNKKMFLDTKWAYPYEQTWMSFMYQETRKGNLKPGILLATPTEHNRIEHYQAKERKEH
jgi:hypothetical protein